QPGLAFDADRRERIFGARNAPAAPIAFAGDNDGMRARIGMGRGLAVTLTLVARPRDAPLLAIVGHRTRLRLGQKLIGCEFTAQADVVVNADRRFETLGPVRDDPLDLRPGSHRTHIDPLVLVKLSVRHTEGIRKLPPAP